MKSTWGRLVTVLQLVVVTCIAFFLEPLIGVVGVITCFLLLSIWVAYKNPYSVSFLTGVASFLLINYFFIEPRYTFSIDSRESWFALMGFFVTSLVIGSLVNQLKGQTQIAQLASKRSEFLRQVFEIFSGQNDVHHDLFESSQLLKREYGYDSVVLLLHPSHQCLSETVQGKIVPENRVLQQILEWGSMVGPGTGNYEDLPYVAIPFGRTYKCHELPIIFFLHPQAIYDLTFLKDVTDQIAVLYQKKMAEKVLVNTRAQVQKEALQNSFLASISHDMRTPLTTITGAATVLLNPPSSLSEDEKSKLLESIYQEAIYLNASTENILSLVRLESLSSDTLRCDWQSPEEIIGSVLSRYPALCDAGRIVAQLDVGLEMLNVEVHLVATALINLIENALRYGDSHQAICVFAHKINDRIQLGVENWGQGFPEDFDATRISRFQRFNSVSKGFGLGLVITQAVAKVHGGELFIHSSNGRTRVAIELPARELHG